MPEKATKPQVHQWAWLVIGIIVFGILMAARAELHNIWLRAAISGFAFGLLFLSVSSFRGVKARQASSRK